MSFFSIPSQLIQKLTQNNDCQLDFKIYKRVAFDDTLQ